MYKPIMLKIYQQTIKDPITFEGIGLHIGSHLKLKFYLEMLIKELFLKELT